MDAGFHGTSTPHHSNTPQCHAQGQRPRPYNLLQQLLPFLPLLHNCGIQISVNPQPHFHPTHLERKQDLMSTNQNTRLTTRRHPTSCILVPRHGRTHDNHPRRLKSPNHSKFTILDPFYPHHFAFPFGLPAVPYRRGGTQCPKTDFYLSSTEAMFLSNSYSINPLGL